MWLEPIGYYLLYYFVIRIPDEELFPKRPSDAPLYTLSRLYDALMSNLRLCIAILRLPKGGFFSLSDEWDISVMWCHIDVQTDWRSSWTYGRALNVIDISDGPLICPSKHRHGAIFFIRLFRETAHLGWFVLFLGYPPLQNANRRYLVCKFDFRRMWLT